MKDFTNEKVSKEYNKFKKMFVIGLLSIVLANLALVWYATKETKSMHQLILDNVEEGKKGHIDVTNVSDYFAYYPGDRNKFYFVMDQEDYLYIIRMSPSNDTKLINTLEKDEIAKIDGVTKKIPSDIKEIALEVYNEMLEAEENEPITVDDFENYFGAIYLDLEANPFGIEELALLLIFLLALFGLGFGLYGGISIWRFKRKINKLTTEEREQIDQEMNDSNAFYYANAHTYLTTHYIVNFASTFEAIPYSDVIWVYQFIQRRNGIKASQSVIVMTKDGKRHTIATLNGLTKKAKDVFDEILETIAKKSTNALIGYTSENRKQVKEKIEK